MTARVIVMPKTQIRHPESECILDTLKRVGFEKFTKLSKGRCYEFEVVDGETIETLTGVLSKLAEDRLANHNTEEFRIEISK